MARLMIWLVSLPFRLALALLVSAARLAWVPIRIIGRLFVRFFFATNVGI